MTKPKQIDYTLPSGAVVSFGVAKEPLKPVQSSRADCLEGIHILSRVLMHLAHEYLCWPLNHDQWAVLDAMLIVSGRLDTCTVHLGVLHYAGEGGKTVR